MRSIRNRKGQGMIEYLILTAIIAVSAIGIVRVVGSNVSIQFANVAKALGSGTDGEQLKAEAISQDLYSKKDLSNFLGGAVNSSAREARSKSRTGAGR